MKNRIKTLRRHATLVIWSCLLLLAAEEIFAQTTAGRDFWVTFPPNFRSRAADDSVYIYIVAPDRSAGSIEYRNRNWESFSMNWGIVDANEPYVLALPASDFELRGINTSSTFAVESDTVSHDVERPVPASIRVRVASGRQAVTVYALNYAASGSGASAILPVNRLGREYMLLAYNGDGRTRNGTSLESISTPSQCAIVASENETSIRIELSTSRTYFNRDGVLEVTLQRGEVYLVQGNLGIPDNLNDDLSGTRIIADKPVAVFAGQQSAQTPYVAGRDGSSRAHLLAQMPPLETWGKQHNLLPFPRNETLTRTDVYRVLAKDDNTFISINGSAEQRLDAGKFLELPLEDPVQITSSKSVLVAAYKSSVRDVDVDPRDRLSDPAFTIVPPVEQYVENINFTTPFPQLESGDLFSADNVFASLVMRADQVENATVGGQPIQSLFDFTAIAESDYVFGISAIGPGPRFLEVPGGGMLQVTTYGIEDAYTFYASRGMAQITEARELDISSQLSVVEARVLRNETHNLQVRLDQLDIPASFGEDPLDAFYIELELDADCLIPVDPNEQGSIENGLRRVLLRRNYANQQAGDILLDFPVNVATNGPECTQVNIRDFSWLGGADDELLTVYEALPGEICKRGDSLEVRLIVADIRAADSDIVKLRITAEDVFVPADFDLSALATIEFDVIVDAGLSSPTQPTLGTVIGDRRIISLRAPFTSAADFAFEFDLRVSAAELAAECTALEVREAQWLGSNDEPLRVSSSVEDAEFCLLTKSIRALLQLGDLQGAPGESVVARVELAALDISPDFVDEFKADFGAARLDLTYNATVLTPADPALRGVLENGRRRTSIELNLNALSAGATLLELPLLVGLGDSEFSDVTATLYFTDLAGLAVSVESLPVTAQMSLLDVWRDDVQGTRLLNPQPGVLALTLEPNPASTQLRITPSAASELTTADLRIYDSRGDLQLQLDDEVRALAASGSLDIDVSQLSSGLYFVRLGLGQDVLVRTLIIR